jgi:cell wall-associated NlpC family hydrolase
VAHPLSGERERMIDTAASMLGQPYRFGGAAPGGFDCSGLVVYAAAGAGIHVPRTAHEQLGFGRPIARGELQAGDLVFMHLAHKELHVGIAIDGERFIHAPSTGGHVRIDSLAASPYARGYLGARRIISTQ